MYIFSPQTPHIPHWNKKKVILLLQITDSCKNLFYIYKVEPEEGVILC